MLLQNGYPNYFFDISLKKFENMAKQNRGRMTIRIFFNRISITFFGNLTHKLGCNLARLIKRIFDVNLAIRYNIVKTASYFQIKCNTPTAFMSNSIACQIHGIILFPYKFKQATLYLVFTKSHHPNNVSMAK